MAGGFHLMLYVLDYNNTNLFYQLSVFVLYLPSLNVVHSQR